MRHLDLVDSPASKLQKKQKSQKKFIEMSIKTQRLSHRQGHLFGDIVCRVGHMWSRLCSYHNRAYGQTAFCNLISSYVLKMTTFRTHLIFYIWKLNPVVLFFNLCIAEWFRPVLWFTSHSIFDKKKKIKKNFLSFPHWNLFYLIYYRHVTDTVLYTSDHISDLHKHPGFNAV